MTPRPGRWGSAIHEIRTQTGEPSVDAGSDWKRGSNPGRGEDKSLRIEVGVRAPADARAQIDAHVAEWLKQSDVPSVAVAYNKDGKVAWTAVYREQSPGVTATEKTLYNTRRR